MVERKAIRGVPWTVLGFAANRGLTMLSTLVLARLLTPEDFGLIGIAGLATMVLNLFADFGLANSLILRRDLDRRAEGTVLTLMTALSLALAALGFLSAGLVADAFREPRLEDVFRALSALVALMGPIAYLNAVLRRELEFRKQFWSQLVSAIVYIVVALACAIGGLGVWSLVLGQVAQRVALALHLFALVGQRVGPAWSRPAALDSLRTGAGFVGQGLVSFAQLNVDYVVVGRALGAAPFGLYAMAFRLSELPTLAISQPVAQVTFSTFTGMLHRGENPRPAYFSGLETVALVAAPAGVLLSASSGPLVETILPEEWFDMIVPLTVLGIWGALQPLHNTLAWMFNSVGLQKVAAGVGLAMLAVAIPAFVVAADAGSLTAIAAVVLARTGVHYAVLLGIAGRRAGVSAAEHARVLAPIVAACVAAWFATRAGHLLFGAAPLELVAGLLAGAGAYAGTVLLLAPALPRRALSRVRRSVAR